jgi:hypothetical protein
MLGGDKIVEKEHQSSTSPSFVFVTSGNSESSQG